MKGFYDGLSSLNLYWIFIFFTSSNNKYATPTYCKSNSENIGVKNSRTVIHTAEVEFVVKNVD